MKTKAKNNTIVKWVLKHKETGKTYSNWTYPSREAARKAAKGKRFKGMYKVVRSGDGGIDPKKLKKSKPVTPKSSRPIENILPSAILSMLESIFGQDNVEIVDDTDETLNDESSEIPMTKQVQSLYGTFETPVKKAVKSNGRSIGRAFHKTPKFGIFGRSK